MSEEHRFASNISQYIENIASIADMMGVDGVELFDATQDVVIGFMKEANEAYEASMPPGLRAKIDRQTLEQHRQADLFVMNGRLPEKARLTIDEIIELSKL